MTLKLFYGVNPNYVATAKDKENLDKMQESIRAGKASLDDLNELFFSANSANMAKEIIPGHIKMWLREYKKYVSSHWARFKHTAKENQEDAEFAIALNAQWGRVWLASAKQKIKLPVYKEVSSYLDLIEKYWNTEDSNIRRFIQKQKQK